MPVLLSGGVLVCKYCSVSVPLKTTVLNNTAYEGQFHYCIARGGLFAPLHPEGLSHKETINEREDYINGETVQLVENRPVMNVTTTRDDGEDCIVYAPMATGRIEL